MMAVPPEAVPAQAQPPPRGGVLSAVGLAAGFAFGALLGMPIGIVVFSISLLRRARAVHAEGVLLRAELVASDPLADRLAGPALVRLSGAFKPEGSRDSDVLGFAIRLQRTASADPRDGDQDLLFASFESFLTAARDRAATDVGDYLANRYSTVAPWWIAGHGPVVLRLLPPPPPAPVQIAARGGTRLARLETDLASGPRFTLTIDGGRVIGELHLRERLSITDRAFRASMFRCGRGVRPVGIRNGIRATVYPFSQTARRLRGG